MRRINFKLIAIFFFVAFSSGSAMALELSRETLAGKWLFTHMILEEGRESKVNRVMEFSPLGIITNYGTDGTVQSQASYKIHHGDIMYIDRHGLQTWKIENYTNDELKVDHGGAKMFFTRQS